MTRNDDRESDESRPRGGGRTPGDSGAANDSPAFTDSESFTDDITTGDGDVVGKGENAGGENADGGSFDGEDRLRRALTDGAQYRQATDADWTAFEARLTGGTRPAVADDGFGAAAPADAEHPEPVIPGGDTTHTPTASDHRWRVPLLAAAAVVAIAVATSAVVTHGFGGSHSAQPAGPAAGSNQGATGPSQSATNPTSTGQPPVDGVRVPIMGPASGVRIAGLGSTASGSGSTASGSGSAASGEQSGGHAGSVGYAAMRIENASSSSTAEIHATFVSGDGSNLGPVRHTTDGTPLGLVSIVSASPDGPSYLWGAVSTGVESLNVLAGPPGTDFEIATKDYVEHFSDGSQAASKTAAGGTDGAGTGGANTGGADAGGADTPDATPMLPGQQRLTWTDIGHGYHAFAIQLPEGTKQTMLVAAGGTIGQQETLSVASAPTAAPRPTAGTENTRGAEGATPGQKSTGAPGEKSTSANQTRQTRSAPATPTNADLAAECITIGAGAAQGISDVGFERASVTFRVDRATDGGKSADGLPGACFFDGRSWWYSAIRDKPLQAYGVTDIGPTPSQGSRGSGTSKTRGRLVWGIVGPSSTVAALNVTVGGHRYDAMLSDVPKAWASDGVTPGSRTFLARVPAEGDVILSAKASAGTTTITIRDNAADTGTKGSANGPAGPFVATHRDSDEGDSGLAQGVVHVINGCVSVVSQGNDGTAYVMTPVFPDSSVEPAEPPAVLHYEGDDYANGDPIELGGGHIGPQAASAKKLPPRCSPNVFSVGP